MLIEDLDDDLMEQLFSIDRGGYVMENKITDLIRKSKEKILTELDCDGDLCKNLLFFLSKIFQEIPKNEHNKPYEVDTFLKRELLKFRNNIGLDPNGSQKFPDIKVGNQKLELKHSKQCNFQFNNSKIELDTTYIFTNRNKLLIISGKLFPEDDGLNEYRMEVEDLKNKWKPYFKLHPTYYAYPRSNMSIKSSFVNQLEHKLSYCDGTTLWYID